MSRVGLMAMSAKPYHMGHDMMIRKASKECDEVQVFVSLSDRKREGEDVPVLGSDMKIIWEKYIQPTMPDNVVITYGGSPIGNVWKLLGKANEKRSTDEFVIYADADDLTQNFPDNLLDKYSGNLFANGQIKREVTERAWSGTKMRAALASGDMQTFMKGMPSTLNGGAIWDVLHATAKNPPQVKTTSGPKRKSKAESLIRQFVIECIRS